MGIILSALAGVVLVAAQATIPDAAPTQPLRNDMACMLLIDLQATDIPPRLARSVRDCIAQGRYDDAMRVYLAYSSFGLFDQQRVRDESGHAALVDLTVWIFGGYPPAVMNKLRAVRDRMREKESAFFVDACRAIAQAGPPQYHPGYLISRGMVPRKSDNDWMVVGFDPASAWHKSLVDLNGCPPV